MTANKSLTNTRINVIFMVKLSNLYRISYKYITFMSIQHMNMFIQSHVE